MWHLRHITACFNLSLDEMHNYKRQNDMGMRGGGEMKNIDENKTIQ